MDIAALAALAGNAVVQAAVTDTWESVRHKIARLFGRGQPHPQTERRLEATHAQLAAAAPADLEKVQAEQAARWSGRLADLLEDHPDAEAELRSLLEEIQEKLSSVGGNVTNTISGGSQHGPVLMGRDFTGINLLHAPRPEPDE